MLLFFVIIINYIFQVNYGKGNLATINNELIKGSLKVSTVCVCWISVSLCVCH